MRIRDWGASGWTFLHSVTLAYGDDERGVPTPEERARMRAFLLATGAVLPCHHCRGHYDQFMRRRLTADALRDRESLFRFMVSMHNDVNARTGKPHMHEDDVRSLYLRGRPPGYLYVAGALGVALVVVLVLTLLRRYRSR